VIAEHPEATELQQEDHFKANINLAWQKLDDYYTLTDRTPIYVAVVILHPRYNYSWIQRKWHDKPNWIKATDEAMKTLWEQYLCQPSSFTDTLAAPASPRAPSPSKRGRRTGIAAADIGDIGGSSAEEAAKE
jgi:hypothetical protein